MPRKSALHNTSQNLRFLDAMNARRDDQYRAASWLLVPFDAIVWSIGLGHVDSKINFDVQLYDGSRLCDPRHHNLLTFFKTWLCIQGHPDTNHGRPISPAVLKQRLGRILAFIDWMLLNGESLQLSSGGLHSISENDIKRMFFTLCRNSKTSESIYQWDQQLADYLQASFRTITEADIRNAKERYEDIEKIDGDRDSFSLGLSDREIVKARVLLAKNGWITQPSADYRYAPNSAALSNAIYKNLLGFQKERGRPTPPELSFCVVDRISCEFEKVPVKDSRPTFSRQRLSQFFQAYKSIAFLPRANISVAPALLESDQIQSFLDSLSTKESGRFATLPMRMGLRLFRESIEFYFKYGEAILNSYVKLAQCCARLPSIPFDLDMEAIVDPVLKNAGVKHWHLAHQMSRVEVNPNSKSNNRRNSSSLSFHERLRANEGLYELILVLYGAITIVIATLSARRKGELDDLIVGSSTDVDHRYLIISNRKSGVLGVRQTIKRPLHPVCAEMICSLERFQGQLAELGIFEGLGPLLRRPHRTNFTLAATNNYTLDLLCDYFETDLDNHGRRYYVRRHQLRRMFAMAFFWSSEFADLDTLRWFMGHLDPEHVWRYITEETPGAALTGARASFATEMVRERTESVRALSDLLEARFGTREFNVLDREEVEEYVGDLIENGSVSVEPEFIHDPNGTRYCVIVSVRSKS